MLQRLMTYFVRGLLVVAPAAVTVYVIYLVFVTIDGWINVERLLDRRIPGVGVLITLVGITLVGVLATNLATRWLFQRVDRLFRRMPLVQLVYTSLKDLIGAFVGDQKRFDRPVLVLPAEGSSLMLVGFLTRDDLGPLGLPDCAAVYVPQSYNFAGNVVVVPRARIRPVQQPSSAMMAFIVSGGVSGALVAPLER